MGRVKISGSLKLGPCGEVIKVFLIFPLVLMSCFNKSAIKPHQADHEHLSAVLEVVLRSLVKIPQSQNTPVHVELLDSKALKYY